MSGARAIRDDGAPLYPMGALPADARAALAEAEAMSRHNTADTPLKRAGRSSPPWYVALAGLLRASTNPTVMPAARLVLPVYEGDRPTDLTDREIRKAETYEPEYRPGRQMHALTVRDFIYDRGRGDGYAAGVRATHALVHRALAGETAGATIPGCPWCREAGGR